MAQAEVVGLVQWLGTLLVLWNKSHVQAVLAKADSLLGLYQRFWTQQASHVMVPEAASRRRLFQSATGIAQGEPFAGWSFAVVLAEAKSKLVTALERSGVELGNAYQIFSYLDDIVLAVGPQYASVVYQQWRDILAEYAMHLQET